jgi:hypothetical protein
MAPPAAAVSRCADNLIELTDPGSFPVPYLLMGPFADLAPDVRYVCFQVVSGPAAPGKFGASTKRESPAALEWCR